MPLPLMLVTVKPLIVIQLLLETVKPLTFPLRVTLAPGAVVNTIGAVEVPDVVTLTFSEWVPAATWTLCPATTFDAAALIVQNGWSTVPEPASEQAGFARSTYRTGPVAALSDPGTRASARPATRGPSARPQVFLLFTSPLPVIGRRLRPKQLLRRRSNTDFRTRGFNGQWRERAASRLGCNGRLRTRRNRRRGRGKRLLHEPKNLGTPSLRDRLQTAELQSRELDEPRAAQGLETQVGEEVGRKDRLVHLKAFVLRLPLAVAVRERLERPRALVLRIPDRRQEERLHHPGARRFDEVRASNQNGVGGRRPGGQLRCPREQPRRPVLHRAEHAPVTVVVHRSPRPPLRLGLLDPLPLVRLASLAGLPPDALVADGRRVLQRYARQPRDARAAHSDPISSTITSTASGSTFAIRLRYPPTRR